MNPENKITEQGEAQIRSLPQWAQIYIRKLLLQVETLENEKNKARDLYIASEEEATLLRERIGRLETTIKTLKELGYED